MSNTLLFFIFAWFLLNGRFVQAQVQQSLPAQDPYDCVVRDIPTAWAFDTPPGSIENSSASFSAVGWDTMNLGFRNEQAVQIEALQLVLEYFDKAGNLVVRVPMYAHVNRAVAHVPSNSLKPSGDWGAPLRKGESELMVGEEQSIRTGHCPVRSVVTFANAQFTDGTVRTYSSPEWRLDASIKAVPMLERIPELSVQPPVSLLAKLRVDAAGNLVAIVPNADTDPRLVGWVRNVIGRGWKFHPAILNGRPIDSELDVLFEIHAKGMAHFVETDPVLKPITLIRFVWTHDISSAHDASPDKLTVMCGILTEGTVATDYSF